MPRPLSCLLSYPRGPRSLAATLALACGAAVTLAACFDPIDAGAPSGGPVVSEAVYAVEVPLSPKRALARQANNYLANYGDWDAAKVAVAREHDVVILNPNGRKTVTRQLVQSIQEGQGDPAHPTLVLCYISIGEDLRTASETDEELATDPRFHGDGTGPRMDPRGPDADGDPITGIDPLGLPSNGGTGYASYYLDDNSVHNDPNHIGDGIPDRNGNFNGCFVNAGDPAWFAALQDMQVDSPDRVAGLREILTTTYGRGLGCDGVFLDTIDTAAPNGWTNQNSSNQSEFEWTAPGFAAFLQRLRAAYPDVVVLQNRGLFYFNPVHPQYQFIPRGNVDFVMFESYRLNSASSNNPNPFFYADNRYMLTPRLMAEANRPDGFRVLSLGYAEGPADQMSEGTLVGASSLGYDSLLEDIHVAERLAGFRHYLTNSSVTLLNTFVLDHADRSDTVGPVWTSTYNDHNPGYPTPPAAATPRVGIQEVVAGAGSLTVRWDVALDLDRVRYALYYQTSPFDFTGDPELESATRLVLEPSTGARYAGEGGHAGVFAYEQTIKNLVPGQVYYLVIRAFDDAPTANEEHNQIVLSGIPTGGGLTAVGRWRASNGVSDLTYRFQYSGTWSYRRVYVDRDRVIGTGFVTRGIGAELLIENNRLYAYAGDGKSWKWNQVLPNPITFTTGAIDGQTYARWTLPQSALGAGAASEHTSLVFQLQEGSSAQTAGPYLHDYTSRDPASPFLGMYAENDAARVYYHAEITTAANLKHVFIDADQNPATGYAYGGVGADYLIENNTLYRHDKPGWSWVPSASAHLVVSGKSHDWWVDRAALGASEGAPVHRLVFQANGNGAPTVLAPVYTHRFSP